MIILWKEDNDSDKWMPLWRVRGLMLLWKYRVQNQQWTGRARLRSEQGVSRMNEREKQYSKNNRNLKFWLNHILHWEGREGNMTKNAMIDKLKKSRVKDVTWHFVEAVWYTIIIAKNVATFCNCLFNVGRREETALLQFFHSNYGTLRLTFMHYKYIWSFQLTQIRNERKERVGIHWVIQQLEWIMKEYCLLQNRNHIRLSPQFS